MLTRDDLLSKAFLNVVVRDVSCNRGHGSLLRAASTHLANRGGRLTLGWGDGRLRGNFVVELNRFVSLLLGLRWRDGCLASDVVVELNRFSLLRMTLGWGDGCLGGDVVVEHNRFFLLFILIKLRQKRLRISI